MKRLVLTGLAFGALNGVAAALTLYAIYRLGPVETFTYFAYDAPKNVNVAFDRYGFPREYVIVPLVLLVLNGLLLPLTLRRTLVRPAG